MYTGTVTSTAGSCAGGSTARTLSAVLPSGSTNAQAEWFAGTSVQKLATAIGGGACPATITLANSINPVPGYESNVAAFGLIQIDGEQFSYYSRSLAANPTPANTLYNVQCAQNGTARAAHSSSATVVPLNNFQPSYPWPVVPTVNGNDTTPSGTAGFFSRMECGQRGVCLPAGDWPQPQHRQHQRVVGECADREPFVLPVAERNQRRGLERGESHGDALRGFPFVRQRVYQSLRALPVLRHRDRAAFDRER